MFGGSRHLGLSQADWRGGIVQPHVDVNASLSLFLSFL